MRCPGLHELPPPPPGKSGWPWTEASTAVTETMPDGRSWPKLSIVTPSWNQASFVEETIRSVLLQGYPNLEYIVMDGGSTDESAAIIRKYEPWLAYWVSERDQGQSHAINKGFARATGEIFGWVNSDDLYERNALQRMATYFATTSDCALLYGNGWYVDEAGKKTQLCSWIRPYDRRLFLTVNFILQPAAFWRRSLWERAGELELGHHWAMDWEWLLRASALTQPHYLRVELARWRVRPGIKTYIGGWSRRAEIAEISRKYGGVWQPTHLVYQLDRSVAWIASRFGDRLGGRVARSVLAPVPWLLKKTLWRGRYLGDLSDSGG
jgi:glycosyltransferase involved in cell wall biosynthesis